MRRDQSKGKLYYWQRLEKSSTPKIDFLAVKQVEVIPIEIKSGAAGRLCSLHLYLEQYSQTPSAYIFLYSAYQKPKEDRLIFMQLYFILAAFL